MTTPVFGQSPPVPAPVGEGYIGGGGAGIGALLASLVYLATTEIFPGDAFAVWGWRCMFFSGILSAVLGVFIFGRLEESPIWARLKRQKAAMGVTAVIHSPIRTLFSREYREILLVNVLLTTGGGAGYYLTSGYLPTFLKVVSGVTSRDASMILIISSLVAIVAAISVGHLSTLWGRRKTFIAIGFLRLVCLPACFIMMDRADGDVMQIAGFAILLSFLGNSGYAPLLIFLNERFPTALRSTGTGISWNLGFAIGGMMPTLVSLAAPTTASLPMVLSLFLVGISVIFMIGAYLAPETRGNLISADLGPPVSA